MAKTGLRESRMNPEHALEPEETLQVKNVLNFFCVFFLTALKNYGGQSVKSLLA